MSSYKFLREEKLNVSKGTAWVECYWEVMLVKDGKDAVL